MNRKHACLLLALLLLLGTLTFGVISLAQTSASYNLEWHVIGGGGGPLSSASYVVNGTVGQGAASPPYSAGDRYVVSGGYWFTPVYRIYLPVLIRK